MKKYCEGIDCSWCSEKEPCIYRIANSLEQQLDQLKGVIKKYEECNKYLVEENGKTYTRLEYKLLKNLAEIKDIVKNMNEECFYGDFKCEDCDFKNGCTYQAKKQILQKISEVINDENS